MQVSVDFHVRPYNSTMRVEAVAGGTSGAPITLTMLNADGDELGEVTLFTHDPVYASRLAALINLANSRPAKADELHIDQLVGSMQAVGITTVVVDDDEPDGAA